MRNLGIVLLAVALLLGLSGTAMAVTDTSQSTVSVGAIDLLDVTDGGTTILTGTAGSDILTGIDTTARLDFTHNSAVKKITAEVLPGGMPGAQDITLNVAVADGEVAGVNVVVDGAEIAGGGTVYDAIPKGILTDRIVTYSEDATLSGTLVGSYTFTVTFTSLDV